MGGFNLFPSPPKEGQAPYPGLSRVDGGRESPIPGPLRNAQGRLPPSRGEGSPDDVPPGSAWFADRRSAVHLPPRLRGGLGRGKIIE